MGFIIACIKFLVAFFISYGIYTQFVWTILYAFPKSIYLSFKGEVKPFSIFATLIPPIVFFTALVAIGSLVDYLEQPPISAGLDASLFVLLFRSFLTKAGREELNAHYQLQFGRFSKYRKT